MIASHKSPLFLTVIFIVSASEAKADAARRDDRLIRDCIHKTGQGRPWLEKTLWALRDQEGGWVGAEIGNSDGSHDLGPLQINSWWVPHVSRLMGRQDWQVRQWLIEDACFNVDVARWILLSGLSVTRDYWKAVGVYHSRTAWRQHRYAFSVALRLQRRFGPRAFSSGWAIRARRAPITHGEGKQE